MRSNFVYHSIASHFESHNGCRNTCTPCYLSINPVFKSYAPFHLLKANRPVHIGEFTDCDTYLQLAKLWN